MLATKLQQPILRNLLNFPFPFTVHVKCATILHSNENYLQKFYKTRQKEKNTSSVKRPEAGTKAQIRKGMEISYEI